jgi:uracil-DNA glycosylase family 4
MNLQQEYNVDCRLCARLSDFLDKVADENPGYHCRPVAPFGENNPKMLIVGLAPGMHGANATGRPFTGDHAGLLLYQTLYKFGFSNQPTAVSLNDGLQLIDCKITNAVKCLPPQNKPVGLEINTCNRFLISEIQALASGAVVLALGGVAHKAVVLACGKKQKDYRFAHNASHKLDNGISMLDSYHCSRYNTQTKRLSEKMFHDVFRQARHLIGNHEGL